MSESPKASSHPRRIFSGMQPTGSLHLGNYLGALRYFVSLQEGEGERIYCVVDLHAITMRQEPGAVRAATRHVAAAYLAAGIDPKRSILFNQSQVSEHAELAWIFNCVARIGWMNRMTQFKDKAGKDREAASVGLYAYPTLMAADILAYKTTHVPVGEDQKQHLELTRDVATKFNLDFNAPDFFPLPEPIIPAEAARIMSLRDGSKKMSKSDPSDASRINLADDADAIARKIRKATTDSEPLPETVEELKGRPEADNLVAIYAAIAETDKEAVLKEFAGQGFGVFKPRLADLAVERFGRISGEMRRLEADPAEIDRILSAGADRARALAAPVLDQVYDVLGLLRGRARPF
ncbi:tryptophan--tRNA ligase [Neomegalonema sp.]|uniref:tryptophan--tRNA ligase n=1 Tax=Neomegalonema sp. TaxID=2039713 RepID=UPI002632A754|nr:tryptophan--tRNA ligase [Neomegalonema sp.]MDD2868965.1 tryptophan--tRNA ligase [Neomegalonema sp.]